MRDRLRLPWLLAKADVILVDDYQPVIYRVDDPRTRIVQLWHASGAFKTVGYSRVGKPGGPSPYLADAQELHPCDRELGPRRAVLCGGVRDPGGAGRPDRDPAHGPLLRRGAAGGRSRGCATSAFRRRRSHDDPLRADLPRRASDATYGTSISISPHCTRSRSSRTRRDLQDAPVRARALPIPAALTTGDRRYRHRIDVNDLLFVVDLLITDYSSIVFEFSTLGRPMLFFAYDLDEYVAERDFYVPFEAFVPGGSCARFRSCWMPSGVGLSGREGRRVRDSHFDHLDGHRPIGSSTTWYSPR